MAIDVLPVAKAVYLCDDVLEDSNSRKVHLLGILNAIRPSGPFPFAVRELCVFVQLTGGIEEAPMHVEVVNAASAEVIYEFPRQRVRFPDRHSTVSCCFRVRNCLFPSAGQYVVELYANQQFVDDRTLHVLAEDFA